MYSWTISKKEAVAIFCVPKINWEAAAAAINVKPRMVDFLDHKSRPSPTISGSPVAFKGETTGAITGATTGAGAAAALDLRLKNIPTPNTQCGSLAQ